MCWNDLKNPKETAKKISLTLKLRGIKPPSQKGVKRSKEWCKRQSAQRMGIKRSSETVIKIQAARKVFYDFNGRISTIRDLIEATKQYKAWRRAILERDRFQCVNCFVNNNKLEVNHKIPLSYYMRLANYNIDVLLKMPELFDTKNGETLCAPCHRSISTWGAKATSFVI